MKKQLTKKTKIVLIVLGSVLLAAIIGVSVWGGGSIIPQRTHFA